ncbi:hypothetical protein OB955_10005 [Halobacteria archaeon AArc-m2/3/4]|uniref:PGF-CTERM protein n=1 Tax=Natronoglomus mannanivorans TaxID=2979990 RepID=A0ABT2QDS0_9EURY|nr:hypothetical protein [Halobacteria archaeon AArc-m2/3/4]
MGSKKFTFIELHLDGDTQFGPKAIGEAMPMLGTEAEEIDVGDDEDEAAGAADEDDSSGKPIAAIVGLVLFVGAAIAFKKLRGGEDDEADELEERDEPDVIVN